MTFPIEAVRAQFPSLARTDEGLSSWYFEGGGGGGGVYYQAVTGEARTTPFRVTTAQTNLRRRERVYTLYTGICIILFIFKASAFAFRSFPLLIRLPSAFAPLGNKRHHHLYHVPFKPLATSTTMRLIGRERLDHHYCGKRVTPEGGEGGGGGPLFTLKR